MAMPSSAICVSIPDSQASSQPVLGQEAVARAHRALVVGRPPAMTGIDGEHHAVEEAAPVAAGAGEEPVHRRRQPDDAQEVQHLVGRLGRGLVDPDGPRRPAAAPSGWILVTMVAVHRARRVGAHGKAAAAALAGDFLIGGAPEAPAGRQQRDRFEKIGLAGAVVAEEDDEAPRRSPATGSRSCGSRRAAASSAAPPAGRLRRRVRETRGGRAAETLASKTRRGGQTRIGIRT